MSTVLTCGHLPGGGQIKPGQPGNPEMPRSSFQMNEMPDLRSHCDCHRLRDCIRSTGRLQRIRSSDSRINVSCSRLPYASNTIVDHDGIGVRNGPVEFGLVAANDCCVAAMEITYGGPRVGRGDHGRRYGDIACGSCYAVGILG